MRRLLRLFGSRDYRVMSPRWVQDQGRRASRIDFQSVTIRFPIQKLGDESNLGTTHKEGKRA